MYLGPFFFPFYSICFTRRNLIFLLVNGNSLKYVLMRKCLSFDKHFPLVELSPANCLIRIKFLTFRAMTLLVTPCCFSCLHVSKFINFNLKAGREWIKDKEERVDKPGLIECKVYFFATFDSLASEVQLLYATVYISLCPSALLLVA